MPKFNKQTLGIPKKTKKQIELDKKCKEIEFLNLSKEGTYLVRLVGNPYAFKRPDPNGRRDALQRFAVYVFDRDDNNKLKIMEKNRQLFEQFNEYTDISGNRPSTDNDSPNFVIKMYTDQEMMDLIGLKGLISKVYPQPNFSPLTQEELKRFKDLVPLDIYYGWR